MSTRKRKAAPSSQQLEGIFEDIRSAYPRALVCSSVKSACCSPFLRCTLTRPHSDLVIRVKPWLSDLSKRPDRSSLLDDLKQLTLLAETFTEQRPKAKLANDVSDTLDCEGMRRSFCHGVSARPAIADCVAPFRSQVSICGTVHHVSAPQDQSSTKTKVYLLRVSFWSDPQARFTPTALSDDSIRMTDKSYFVVGGPCTN